LIRAEHRGYAHRRPHSDDEVLAMVDHYQLNLGSLRSSITLTLHTHHAARLWQGRSGREGVHPILGMPGYISVTNLLKHASSQGDPYADWFMLQLEEKLLQARGEMGGLTQQVSQVERALPTQVDVGDNLNIHPVTLPLFIGSQLGFLAIYLLTDYDAFVRRVLLAHHTALIGRVDMETWIDGGAHLLRSLFGLAQRYRVAGVSRDDMAANNARAREAIDKFGMPPQDILQGTRRSQFAPPIAHNNATPDNESASASEVDEQPTPGAAADGGDA